MLSSVKPLSAALHLLFIALPQLIHCESSPIVEIQQGSVQGTLSEYVSGVNVFKGIPFAGSVAGEARWKPPPAPAQFTSIFNASTYGNYCPQAMGPGPLIGDEDCLNLNIWTPENFTVASNMSVYFWIYGGRFLGGGGAVSTYDGSGLAKKDIVVVTFNYRLGSLGWLAHPELSAESGHNASGNYGLMDQMAALRWTIANIRQFGGNPEQITLGGQSAGSASVLSLVYSPLTKGLFQGAIAESGARGPRDPLTGSLATSHNNLSAAEAQGASYIESLNLNSIAEARAASVDVVLGSDSQTATLFAGTKFEGNAAYGEPPLFRPVIDGYVLPHTYGYTLDHRLQNDVPIMTGSNKDESGASPDPGVDLATFQANNSALFSPNSLYGRFKNLFPAHDDAAASNATNFLYRNQSAISQWIWANYWANGGAKSDVYTYYWTHAPPGQTAGAFHGSEINYAMDNIPYGITLFGQSLNWTAVDYQIAGVMSSYWVNFINTGNPNGEGLAEWVPSSKSGKTTMELGDAWGTMSIAGQKNINFMKDFFGHQIMW